MKYAVVNTRAFIGLECPLVEVEVHLLNGLPGFSIVGLAETTVKESKERVKSAIINSGFDFPQRKIVINLSPAALPKEGGRYDLPIAIGILAATNQLPKDDLKNYEFAGELTLAGEIRPIQASLQFAKATAAAQKILVLPFSNCRIASINSNLQLVPTTTLVDICEYLQGKKLIPYYDEHILPEEQITCLEKDFAEVHGQSHAKRALEIAAAGKHSVLMLGSPGTGKTMLASRLPTIMPPLTKTEIVEILSLQNERSYDNQNTERLQRPFRSPHHTASPVAIIGGGNPLRPGEVSLAHHGILFLDELPEFDRKVLEVLREPLDSQCIHISRANQKIVYPANFQLIAAMNPCPCGHYNTKNIECECTNYNIRKYYQKVSGPIFDRIDMNVTISKPESCFFDNRVQNLAEPSSKIRERVITAYTTQLQRQGKSNATLTNKEIHTYCNLSAKSRTCLQTAIEKFSLSARSFYRILKLARTIADLDINNSVNSEHIHEALAFRHKDITSMLH